MQPPPNQNPFPFGGMNMPPLGAEQMERMKRELKRRFAFFGLGLVIFIVAIRSQSLFTVIVAVSLLAIPALARIVRGATLQVADRDYVKAAQVLGVKKLTILWREVLPNVMPTLVSFAFLTFGIVLVAESSLSFLGLSVEAPTITWGSIIGEGRIKFNETPHMVFLPSAVLFLTVLSLNFVGDQLLKRFDIKESGI